MPFIIPFKSGDTVPTGSIGSNSGAGERLFKGIIFIISLAFSIADFTSSHTAEAIPAFIADSAETFSAFGVIKNSESFAIITKSEEHASIEALPAQVSGNNCNLRNNSGYS